MYLKQILSIFLITLLMAGPLSANDLILPFRPTAIQSTCFSVEAFAERPISAHSDLGRFLTPRKIIAITALAALAYVASHHSLSAMLFGSLSGGGIAPFFLLGSIFAEYPQLESKPDLSQIVNELIIVDEFQKHYPKAVTAFGSARILEPSDPVYKLAYDFGKELFLAGLELGDIIPPRTGAGPSIMAAVPQGYLEARKRAGIAKSVNNLAQGVRIVSLPFEQGVNDYIEYCIPCMKFATRKLGLHRHAKAIVSFPGGIGTEDETNEGRQRRKPFVLLEPTEGPFRYYWTNRMRDYAQAWENVGLKDRETSKPFVTSSPKEAVQYILNAKPNHWNTPGLTLPETIRELVEASLAMDTWETALTFLGRPVVGSPEWKVAGELMYAALESGRTVRIVNRGAMMEAMTHLDLTRRFRDQIQGVFFIPPGENLRPAETRHFPRMVYTHDPTVHQILITDRTRAVVASPGREGTLNRVFDMAQLNQYEMLKHQIHLLLNGGTRFWHTFMDPMFQIMLLQVPVWDPATHQQKIDPKTNKPETYGLISAGDEKRFNFFDTVGEGWNLVKTLDRAA